MNEREALKLARGNICSAKLCEINSMSSRREMIRLMDDAIAVIDQALAQPQRKPLTDFDEWYKTAIWGNEDFKQGCRRAWDAAIEAANGIKG